MNNEIKERILILRRLITFIDVDNQLVYIRNNSNYDDIYINTYSIFNDTCLNIRYTLNLLNKFNGINVLVGNVINESLSCYYIYVVKFGNVAGGYSFNSPLRTMYDLINYPFNCIYANGLTYDNIITKVTNIKYNYKYINKILGLS